MAEEHLGPVGTGIAVRHKPDFRARQTVVGATTRRMAKSASAGSLGSPITNGGAPDLDCTRLPALQAGEVLPVAVTCGHSGFSDRRNANIIVSDGQAVPTRVALTAAHD